LHAEIFAGRERFAESREAGLPGGEFLLRYGLEGKLGWAWRRWRRGVVTGSDDIAFE